MWGVRMTRETFMVLAAGLGLITQLLALALSLTGKRRASDILQTFCTLFWIAAFVLK